MKSSLSSPQEILEPEKKSGEIIIHHKNSLIASTIGRVRDLVTGVMLGDYKRLFNPFTKKEKQELEEKIKERFKNIHFKDDLHIYLGASGFGKEYLKQRKEEGFSNGPWKHFVAKWQDFWVNFSRSDAYSPDLNTVSIFDEKYSTVAHEIGHAIDRNAYEAEHLRNTSSQRDKGRYEYLNDERIASNFALRFMTPQERKKYSGDLAAAYGTYQGATVGGILDIPLFVAGRVAGNPIIMLGGLLAPFIGACVGAYSQRIRNFFRFRKGSKNTLLNIDASRDMDTNPYWEGMFEGNQSSEKEFQKVPDLRGA